MNMTNLLGLLKRKFENIFQFCSTSCIWDRVIFLTRHKSQFTVLKLRKYYGPPFNIERMEDQSNLSDEGNLNHDAFFSSSLRHITTVVSQSVMFGRLRSWEREREACLVIAQVVGAKFVFVCRRACEDVPANSATWWANNEPSIAVYCLLKPVTLQDL